MQEGQHLLLKKSDRRKESGLSFGLSRGEGELEARKGHSVRANGNPKRGQTNNKN